LLLAAFYNPIWTGRVVTPENFGLLMVLFGLLAIWKLPPWSVVIIAAIGGYALEAI
jgi:chromate transporter